MWTRISLSAALAALCLPLPALAQSVVAPDDSALGGDHLMIGAGMIYGPSYDGSDDYVASPVPVLQGRVRGIEITPRPGGVALDLVPDSRDRRIGWSFGPVLTYSGERKRQIKDPVVRAAGRLKASIDLGVNGGVTVYRMLHAYDAVTVSADALWDVNGAHSGMSLSPQVSYFTPISRAAIVTLSLGATHVDDAYAAYYQSVSPAQAAASGLPVFQAQGGWKSVRAGFLGGYDLDGNLLNGGFALFAIGSYSRLLNDARRTPYTALRGDPDQWMMGLGLGYSF